MTTITNRMKVTSIQGTGDITKLGDCGPTYEHIEVTLQGNRGGWADVEATMVINHGDPCPAIGDIYVVEHTKTETGTLVSINKEST